MVSAAKFVPGKIGISGKFLAAKFVLREINGMLGKFSPTSCVPGKIIGSKFHPGKYHQDGEKILSHKICPEESYWKKFSVAKFVPGEIIGIIIDCKICPGENYQDYQENYRLQNSSWKKNIGKLGKFSAAKFVPGEIIGKILSSKIHPRIKSIWKNWEHSPPGTVGDGELL